VAAYHRDDAQALLVSNDSVVEMPRSLSAFKRSLNKAVRKRRAKRASLGSVPVGGAIRQAAGRSSPRKNLSADFAEQ
jgi:hypothetical protein